MFVHCQKCRKDVEPGIKRETLKDKQVTSETQAICPECQSALPINQFMLKTLVSLGRFYVKPKATAAFSFDCKSCGKCEQAKLSPDRKLAFCGSCGSDLKLSEYMIKAMSMIKSGSIDTGH